MEFEGDVELRIVSVEVVLKWCRRNGSADWGGVEDEQERSEDRPSWHTVRCRERCDKSPRADTATVREER